MQKTGPLGIGHQFLLEPSAEYDHLKDICGRGLRHLGLALNVGSKKGLPTLNDRKFTSALRVATQLESFSLHTTAETTVGSFDNTCCLSINTLPLAEWKSLRCLTLSRLPIRLDDLLSLLRKVPPSPQTVELIQLRIVAEAWENTLERIKGDLRWSRNHPRIAIAQEKYLHSKIWIEEDFLRFLDGYFNPFAGNNNAGSKDPNSISYGFGTEKNDFGQHSDRFNGPNLFRVYQISLTRWGIKPTEDWGDGSRLYTPKEQTGEIVQV